MSKVVFLDTETTSLNETTGEVWECALIERTPHGDDEHHWMLPVELTHADPFALDIGQFHQRHPQGNAFRSAGPSCTDLDRFASQLARLTHGAHLVGAIPSFDEERLRRLLRGTRSTFSWHYHIVDIESLAVGYLCAKGLIGARELPWKSKDLSRALDIDPDSYEVHTALGDARWARDVYDKVTGGR